jgi:acetylornithine deacetylase/succinyl-diaminopimelate desuccinylase-like protein
MIDELLLSRVLDLAVEIQQIPAPSLDEGQRAEFVRSRFEAENLGDISVDDLGNVYACLPGAGHAPPLVVSAHLDTVFPLSTALHVRRDGERIYGPGIGDNSLGIAGLFGLLWSLRNRTLNKSDGSVLVDSWLPGDIWLVANVGEEGLGNLRGMRAVVERFADRVLAYLVIEGMALGQIYHRALGVQRYRISAQTPGGHSWVDYGRPSAIHELAKLVVGLDELQLPQKPRCSLNVGTIHGGISINTIAPEAYLELDLRSESAPALESLVKSTGEIIDNLNRPDVQFSMDVIGQRPAGEIPELHPIVQLAKRCLLAQNIQPNFTIASTDANIPLSKGLPAICLGLTTGYGAHTSEEYINTRPLSLGMAQLVAFVEAAFSTQ